jgi:predicted aspartyl protease
MRVRLAVDTGANATALDHELLRKAGFGIRDAVDHVRVFTAGGVMDLPVFRIQRVTAFDIARDDLLVAAPKFPPESGIDGVLGLDFFRGLRLTIDLREGWIDVT